MTVKARVQAYYLPQFHPIPENDEWWGKGFTEWTNVARAKPLFRGHWQPHFPADLGFYDLRVPEVREAQAEMARTHGIEGFCYYHYWFGNGRRLLERPFDEVLASGKPDFPFSLCWANETWTGIWFGDNRTLIDQRYEGRDDIKNHFRYLLKAFSDPRYITVDGKSMFQILTPSDLPNSLEMTDTLRELAHEAGLKGLFIVAGYRASKDWNPAEHGFDAVTSSTISSAFAPKANLSIRWFTTRLLGSKYLYSADQLQRIFKKYFRVFKYEDILKAVDQFGMFEWECFPCILPNWDNTPRSGIKGVVVTDSTPKLFKKHVANAINYVQKYEADHRIVFIKSWNEWAEGNYLEPDSKFGDQYLSALRSVLKEDEPTS